MGGLCINFTFVSSPYRVPVNDNPGGEMSGGITSGMRDGSAHVLRCLKVCKSILILSLLRLSVT